MIRFRTSVAAGAAALSLLLAGPAFAKKLDLPDASFELLPGNTQVLCTNGSLALPQSAQAIPWGCSGDVAVLTTNSCLMPQLPTDGAAAVCLSTGSFFGGDAVGGVASSLISPPVDVTLKPEQITVSFDFEFGTREGLRSVQFNDSLTVTLLTGAGSFPLLSSDTWGTTPKGASVKLDGDPALAPQPNPGCDVDLQTSRVVVTAKRSLPPAVQDAIKLKPVHVQFQITDQGDSDRVSFACIDNVKISAQPVSD